MKFIALLRLLVALAAFVVVASPTYVSAETLQVCNSRLALCKSAPINIALLGQYNCQMNFYRCQGKPVPLPVINAYCNEWKGTECRRYKSASYCNGDGFKKCVLDKQFGGNVRDHRNN